MPVKTDFEARAEGEGFREVEMENLLPLHVLKVFAYFSNEEKIFSKTRIKKKEGNLYQIITRNAINKRVIIFPIAQLENNFFLGLQNP